MRQVVKLYNPYRSSQVPSFTRAATTPKKRRQWLHVYDSARRRGYSEKRAIMQASGTVRNVSFRKRKKRLKASGSDIAPFFKKKRFKPKKHPIHYGGTFSQFFESPAPRKRKTRKRKTGFLNPSPNQSIITDTIAGRIADSVASKVGRMFSRKSAKKRARMTAKRKKRKNPHMAIVGLGNPRRRKRMARRRRRNLPGRNAKGRFVKASSVRRRNRTRRVKVTVNRRRYAKRTHRRKRRNRAVRVVVKNRWRTRYVKMANKRRRRKSTRRRRRNYSRARTVNVRRRRRSNPAVNPRRRRRRYSKKRGRLRRRRNPGLGGIVGRVRWKDVFMVAGGVFIGDKISGFATDWALAQFGGAIGTSDTTKGLIKLAVGVLTAGFVWRFQPSLGMGIAVGAANSLLNQYVFGPAWGYVTPYLPTGMAGMGDYVNRSYKVDNWLGAGQGAAVAGLGNPLMRKTL